MDLGSIFLILALLLLVSLFISRPLLERKSVSVSAEEQEYSSLLAERERILSALQELDADFTMGKIPEEDYPAQRALLLQLGADVLRKLDAYKPGKEESEPYEAGESLESALAARRAAYQTVTSGAAVGNSNGNGYSNNLTQPDDELEALIASRRRARKEKAGGFCSQCGSPILKSDAFCPKCGAKV